VFAVFTRRLDLKLFLSFVLLCLLLFGASLFGAWFLSSLHRNVSTVLNENVRSTEVAEELEATVKRLIQLLRALGKDHIQLIDDENEVAASQLAQAQNLANLDEERDNVNKIAGGLHAYFEEWASRKELPPPDARKYDEKLATELEQQVLRYCLELRKFNMRQIVKSEEENQAIINPLLWGMLGVGLGGSLAGLVIGYTTARRLRHSIGQLSVSIRDAAGRLNRELGSVTLKEEGDLPAVHRQMQHLHKEISHTIEQLQQREHEVLRAEQLAAVGQIAAGVAHELRNPLTAIKMLVQTGLEGPAPSGLPAEDLAVIEQSIRRMEQYIQIFLDFARPPRSERRRLDLLDVVRRAVALVEGRARRQKVIIELDFPDWPVHASLDPEQIQQVLVNLLINALDALPRGGVIRVQVHLNGDTITVRVQDNGPGLPAAIRDRLFEPFVTGKPDGVGLGLSICKRLIEAHGGSIHGTNAPAGGAVITFTLPAAESEIKGPGAGTRNQGTGVPSTQYSVLSTPEL
jgi:signal transduction histidine kinase